MPEIMNLQLQHSVISRLMLAKGYQEPIDIQELDEQASLPDNMRAIQEKTGIRLFTREMAVNEIKKLEREGNGDLANKSLAGVYDTHGGDVILRYAVGLDIEPPLSEDQERDLGWVFGSYGPDFMLNWLQERGWEPEETAPGPPEHPGPGPEDIYAVLEKRPEYRHILAQILKIEAEHPDGTDPTKIYTFEGPGWTYQDLQDVEPGQLGHLVSTGIIAEVEDAGSSNRKVLRLASPEAVRTALELEPEGPAELPVWSPPMADLTPEMLEEFLAIAQDDPLKHWASVVAPEVSGLERAKEAIVILLASPMDAGTSRGRANVLLYGPPGTAKSILRRFVTHMFRAPYIGSRSSGPGLTVDCRTDPPTLGAMPLAHASPWRVLTIDELDKFGRPEQENLLDALEDGEFAISIGGFVRTYPAEIRTIACANEVGPKYMKPELFDRFDFKIFIDLPTKESAAPIVKHMAMNFMREPKRDTVERLRMYLAWTAEYVPEYTDAERAMSSDLINYYIGLRYSNGEKVNVRDKASILRVAYTLAKLRRAAVNAAKDVVQAIDVLDPDLEDEKLHALRLKAGELGKE